MLFLQVDVQKETNFIYATPRAREKVSAVDFDILKTNFQKKSAQFVLWQSYAQL